MGADQNHNGAAAAAQPASPHGTYGRPLSFERLETRAPVGRPRNEWVRLGRAIAIGGGVFGAGASVLSSLIDLVVALGAMINGEGFSAPGGPGGLFGAIISVPIGFVSGILWYGFICLGLVPLAAFVAWLLDLRSRGPHFGGGVGALAAYPFVIGFSQALLGDMALGWSDDTLLSALCFVSVLCGQAGGAYGGIANHRDRRKREGPDVTNDQRIRINVRQLLLIMVVASVVLTTLRLANLLTMTLLATSGVWLALAVITHGPAIWIAKRRWRAVTRNKIARRHHQERLRGERDDDDDELPTSAAAQSERGRG